MSEPTMLILSPAAREELDAYFSGREKSPLRIYAAPGGCSGRRLALTLGEPDLGDTVCEADGYTFCIDPELLNQVGMLTVDLSHTGFSVNAGTFPGGGCSGCSGCGPER
jgi:iron-sulfur cluster assembly protein